MRTYHPENWSQQAREMCDKQIKQINSGWQTIDGAVKFFSQSYRAEIIRNRAAKRFGRMVRAGKVHEDLEAYHHHFYEDDC
jgi:hypothetical protein